MKLRFIIYNVHHKYSTGPTGTSETTILTSTVLCGSLNKTQEIKIKLILFFSALINVAPFGV